MGEALITRRGGVVRTGTVATVTQFTMTDPALAGVRNAVILLQTGGTSRDTNSSYGGTVQRICVENGEVSQVWRSELSNSKATFGDISNNANAGVTYDPTTGTFACYNNSDYYNLEFMLAATGGVIGEYKYYTWD